MENPYFKWLCKKVKRKGKNDITYTRLLEQLFGKPFYVVIPADENRALDGLNLRNQYIQHTGEEPDILFERCSWLELLIALSRRISFVLCEESDSKHASQYFWMLLHNLGIDNLDDNCPGWGDEKAEIYIWNVLKKAENRSYTRSGFGGIFPLKYSQNDQREVEIWYQMHAWISENNDISLDKNASKTSQV